MFEDFRLPFAHNLIKHPCTFVIGVWERATRKVDAGFVSNAIL